MWLLGTKPQSSRESVYARKLRAIHLSSLNLPILTLWMLSVPGICYVDEKCTEPAPFSLMLLVSKCPCLLTRPRSPDMATWIKPSQLEGPEQNLSCGSFYWEQSNFLIPLPETDYNDNCQDQYNCSCQDTMAFASYTWYTISLSKSSCPVQLPHFLDYQADIQRATEGPECFTAWGSASVSQELKDTQHLRGHRL